MLLITKKQFDEIAACVSIAEDQVELELLSVNIDLDEALMGDLDDEENEGMIELYRQILAAKQLVMNLTQGFKADA